MASRSATLTRAAAWPRLTAGLLVALLAGIGFAAWTAFDARLFNDGDTGWHLATGRLILATGQVPTRDPFSWTAFGWPWQTHEWLAEVLLAAGFGAAGWPGAALVPALAMGLMLALVGAEAARWLDWRRVAILLPLMVAALVPFCLARPHVIAWPLLAGWTIILLRAREAGRAPPLAAALLMLVWANTHASWALGLGIAAAFGLEALIAGPDRRAVLTGWGGFGLLSGLAVLATPQGIEGVTFPFMVSGMKALDIIAEWRPTSFLRYPWFEVWLVALIAVCLGWGVRLGLVRLALLLGLFHLAVLHERHEAVFVIVAALLLPPAMATAFARPSGSVTPAPDPAAVVRPSLPMPLWLLPAAALIGLVAVRLTVPMERRETKANPAHAIAAVPEALRRTHVFNSYSTGGTLIFHGLRPYVDGRADMYGDAHVADWWRMHQGDIARFRSVAAAQDIRWTILERKAPLARALDHEAGWRRLYADRFAVVHVRTPGPGR